MTIGDYKTGYEGKDKYSLYFSRAPLKSWKYYDFERHFQALETPPSKKTLISSYKQCLAQIKDNKKTPTYVKEQIETLLKDITTNSSSSSGSTTYHINQGPSSVVNYGNNNAIFTSHSNIATEEQNNSGPTPKCKRTFDDVDDEQQSSHTGKQGTPIRPVDSIFSKDTTTSVLGPSPTPAEFRKAAYAYGVKALCKEFFIEDNFNLQQLINSFVPRTLGEQLDMMSAKLLMSIDLTNMIHVNALKLSLSRIVDTVNGKITTLFRQYLDDAFWEELSSVNITLCGGMPPTSKILYQEMMTEGSNNGKLDRKQLRIAVAKKKLSLLESNQTDILQVLDIIDLLAKHCLSDAALRTNNNESELTTHRKFAKILDEILDDTMLDMLDSESSCKVPKSIAEIHEKIYDSNIPLNNGFGRRIDLILATKNLELSTSEWKRAKTLPVKCLQQQSKNIRMNKAILTYLLSLPCNEADNDRIFTVGMDWTGPVGYMFALKQVNDIYVAKPLSTLLMPTYLEELPSFEKTLDYLYAWRNHHLSLKEIMLPALRKLEQDMFFSSVLGTPESTDISSSPNIYLTPSRRRRSQNPATNELDLDGLNNDEE